MDWKLELVTIPVSDVDRAKAFYVEKAGFVADHDHIVSDAMRFVHGFNHVVDQALHQRALDVGAFEGAGLGPEDGVTHVRDLQYRHDPTNYTGTV